MTISLLCIQFLKITKENLASVTEWQTGENPLEEWKSDSFMWKKNF